MFKASDVEQNSKLGFSVRLHVVFVTWLFFPSFWSFIKIFHKHGVSLLRWVILENETFQEQIIGNKSFWKTWFATAFKGRSWFKCLMEAHHNPLLLQKDWQQTEQWFSLHLVNSSSWLHRIPASILTRRSTSLQSAAWQQGRGCSPECCRSTCQCLSGL